MKIVFIIILFLSAADFFAQTDTLRTADPVDELIEEAAADKEISDYQDIIEYLLQNKIDLNTATIIDLMKIPYFDRQTAASIIRIRNLSGGIRNKEELLQAENVTPDLVEKIFPFLSLGETSSNSIIERLNKASTGINFSLRTRSMSDIQKEKGFETGKFDGSPLKLYNRLILKYEEKFRLGVLAEKDAGEKSLNDFTTFHLFAKDLGIIKSAVIGDYIFEFGEGLALWSRYSINKGTETVSILSRGGKGIVPYLSSDENTFFRGAAINISFAGLNLSAFASDKKSDGSIDRGTNEMTSIRSDGLHRNAAENSHKNIIEEKVFGISADCNFGETASLGVLYLNSTYENNFRPGSILDPSGNKFISLSASYSLLLNDFTFSGETSFSVNSAASINNIEFKPDKNFSIVFSLRNYPKEYIALHSNGFGEKGGTQNENGFYTGLKLRSGIGIFSFYYDQFRSPYSNEKIPFSSGGTEFLIYYTVSPFRNTNFKLRYSFSNKDYQSILNDQFGFIKKRIENLRLELDFSPSNKIRLKSRFNFSYVSSPVPEKGFLLFQECKYFCSHFFWVNARVILFRTDSYDSRIYEFENDLPGTMYNPLLYGEGMRWYVLIQYKTEFGLTLSAKYSELIKPGLRVMGSGDSEIQGNLDNRLSIQADLQF